MAGAHESDPRAAPDGDFAGAERGRARKWLAHEVDLERAIARREGDPRLFAALHGFLAERGLAELEREFSRVFVSHSGSGEVVKGHAIVLAELGLCPYSGKVVRDPRTFAGEWAKTRRAEHVLARLAFTQGALVAPGRRRAVPRRGHRRPAARATPGVPGSRGGPARRPGQPRVLIYQTPAAGADRGGSTSRTTGTVNA